MLAPLLPFGNWFDQLECDRGFSFALTTLQQVAGLLDEHDRTKSPHVRKLGVLGARAGMTALDEAGTSPMPLGYGVRAGLEHSADLVARVRGRLAAVVAATITNDELAHELYEAYIIDADGLAWVGRPCPPWERLTDAVRQHWRAAAERARGVLLENSLSSPARGAA